MSQNFILTLISLFLNLMASKSAEISVYHKHNSFVFTSRFFGSTFLATFQIGILAQTTLTLTCIRLLSATCIFALTNLGNE